MSELYKNHRRCPSCNYWADIKEWSLLQVGSNNGYTRLTCKEYDLIDKKRTHIGSVDLLACPNCRTIIWER